ncbi:MAG TPA: pyridoxal-phosphate dependent enzyme [Anaerolineae bacterium]|nr:pyridoxal-phosphate dependent enzyme [Anaerolineae bacterium]
MTKLHLRATCVECGQLQWTQPLDSAACEACGSDWLQGHYDYAAFKRELLRGLPGRPHNLWRYHDVLPIVDPTCPDLIVAGGTPLRLSRRYAATLGSVQLYLKDERLHATGSFKDRQAAVSVAAMLEAGIHECVIASTGNAAVSYAAACARAGIKLWVFMTSLVPPEKLREAALFGAEVVKVSGTYEQAKQISADFAQRRHLFYDRGARSLPARESFKTIAYEIVEQLGWRAPDWYFQAVSGGLGPLGVYRGFQELFEMGLIDRIPALGLIQVEGCSPMVQAFKAGRAVAEPVTPETRIAILSTGDPGKAYTLLRQKIQHSGGTMESVSDLEAWTAMQTLARTEGMAVEPAAAVAFAGLEKLAKQGEIKPNDLVVVNCSGHTFPVEKHVLGDQWRVDVDLAGSQQPAPRDGLLAALERLDENVTTVLIVDDNADDALLIRRLLEAKKSYRVFHALDGQAGLLEARQRLPDLVVLDLTMPNLDGFSVLEELKEDARTRHIPVIVVTARDITEAERQRLTGRVEALYQKAALSPRAFVDQVVHVLDVKTGREEEH